MLDADGNGTNLGLVVCGVLEVAEEGVECEDASCKEVVSLDWVFRDWVTTDDTGVIAKEKPPAADNGCEPVDAERGVMRRRVVVGTSEVRIRVVLGNLRVGGHAHPSVRFRKCDWMEMMLFETMLSLYSYKLSWMPRARDRVSPFRNVLTNIGKRSQTVIFSGNVAEWLRRCV